MLVTVIVVIVVVGFRLKGSWLVLLVAVTMELEEPKPPPQQFLSIFAAVAANEVVAEVRVVAELTRVVATGLREMFVFDCVRLGVVTVRSNLLGRSFVR